MRKVNLKIAAAVCVFMMTIAFTVEADTHYVGPGQSIQAAINAASTDDWIEVAAGTYTEAINFIGKAVRLYSSGGPEVTIIDGTGHYHVVQCVSGEDANTVLEGFTITGGDANGFPDNMGGGMYCENSSPTVRGCTFSGNSADGGGGGMCNYNNSNPTVTGCTFSNNTGNGMKNFSSSPTVSNCIFSNNTSSGNGGGMYNQSSSLTLTNCTFTGNSTGMNGGGIYNFQSSPTVTNCTFSGNIAAALGGGVRNWDSSPTVTNCILWDNEPDEISSAGTSSPVVSYSDVNGGYGGTGNIDADPLFLNASVGDFRLTSSGSPCVDTGNNSVVTEANDLAGNPRVVDGDCDSSAIVDMGAYELQPKQVHNITQDRWYETIQAAIDDADNADQIEVGPGTYYEAINFKGKAVRLYSTSGPNDTTIDGTRNYHVVKCVNNEDANTILEGFTITGGNANGTGSNSYGGGMYNDGSSPTVTGCTFSGNSADYGGGMLNANSSPTVTNCIFTGNTAVYGGGMRNDGSSPTVTGCTFSGNEANSGGGMLNSTSSPTVTGCTFSGNTAGSGGGMNNFNEGNPTVTNCTFSGNTATSQGGGMFSIFESNPTVTNCTFSNNTATHNGGGMHNEGDNNPTVTGCTFSGNSANYGGGMYNYGILSPTVTNCTFSGNSANYGGGMYNVFALSLTVTNCTFSGNTADYYCGGMCNDDDSSATVTNCTFSDNSATTEGGGMYNYNDSSATVTNCILWGNTPDEIINIYNSSATVTYSDVEGGYTGTGNIDADPNFVDANNPDPNLVDLRLMPVSPCIDAGDTTAVPGGFWADLDGNCRVSDNPESSDTGISLFGLTVDMGAYEFYCSGIHGDINCDGVVNFKDFAIMAENWLVGAEP